MIERKQQWRGKDLVQPRRKAWARGTSGMVAQAESGGKWWGSKGSGGAGLEGGRMEGREIVEEQAAGE